MRKERINNNERIDNERTDVERVDVERAEIERADGARMDVERVHVERPANEVTEEDLEGKVEKAYLQPDGTIERELYTAEDVNAGPRKQDVRSESGPTGTYGEGDRTDRDGWLTAGMADDEYSRNPEGFYKDKDRSYVKPEDQPKKNDR